MLKLFNLKTWSSIALSLSMLTGILALSPVTSAFAKKSPAYIPAKVSQDTSKGYSYSDRSVDSDGDEMNESSEVPYNWLWSPDNLRADGKWSVNGR